MNAEILCIGTEILLGDIVNTNGAFLARQLAQLGIDIYHQSVVGDNADRLRDALRLALSRADMVITTGGLGPTYDDITKKTVADYFGVGMVTDEASMRRIKEFEARINRTVKSNELQAAVPEGSTVFFNEVGFAPGLALEKEGKTVIMLPGPPNEMRPMFLNKVVAYLRRGSTDTILSKTVHIFGMGESQVEETLRDIMTSCVNPTVAPYAKFGEVQVRISAKAPDEEAAMKMIEPVLERIRERLGDLIYGIDVGSMHNAVVMALSEKGLTLAAAESCTGGKLSAAITDIPGASKVFIGGVCAYSDAVKRSVLGVSARTLKKYGAVSEQTASEMAKGIRRIAGADIGISITGIAGPDGGTAEKPVGTVCISVDSGGYGETKKFMLDRGYGEVRETVRHMSVLNALSMILKAAKANKPL